MRQRNPYRNGNTRLQRYRRGRWKRKCQRYAQRNGHILVGARATPIEHQHSAARLRAGLSHETRLELLLENRATKARPPRRTWRLSPAEQLGTSAAL